MTFDVKNKTILVTGANRGIGKAILEEALHRGAAKVYAAVRSIDSADTLVAEYGDRVVPIRVDLNDPDSITAAAETATDVDVVVNNAGVTSAGPFEDESLEDLRWIVDINIWGVVNGCQAFLPELRRADEAHIVNMSSMVGLLGLPHNVSYSLTKGAVRAFSEALRAELVATQVGVTVVFPGAIHTNITAGARGGQAARLAEMGQSRLAPYVMRPPSAVARRIVSAIERDRARVVVGPDAHVVSALSRVLPGRSGLVGRLTNRLDR